MKHGVYSDNYERRILNFVELWDRLPCVPWFNVLLWQVSGLTEYNTISVAQTI